MSDPSLSKDGLLLLLQAAEEIDKEIPKSYHNSEKWEVRSGSSRNSSNSPPMYSCSMHRRGAPSTRCTHNELEKSRRAHLRTCMEALKERLTFDSDVPRITMLTVLRKATASIQILKKNNEYLEACEDGEKQKLSQLLKRRQTLRKQLDAKRSRSLKIQSWRERNRNYSECSALTTSSEDSELDYGSRQLPPNICGAIPNCSTGSPTQVCTTDQFTYGNTAYSVPPYRKVPLSPGTILSPSYGADAYDASSSDSGFEEVTVSCSEETIPPIKNRGSNTATDGVYTMQSFKAYLE